MKFEAAQIHFLGDVFAPVAVLITWWLSDRVANRYSRGGYSLIRG